MSAIEDSSARARSGRPARNPLRRRRRAPRKPAITRARGPVALGTDRAGGQGDRRQRRPRRPARHRWRWKRMPRSRRTPPWPTSTAGHFGSSSWRPSRASVPRPSFAAGRKRKRPTPGSPRPKSALNQARAYDLDLKVQESKIGVLQKNLNLPRRGPRGSRSCRRPTSCRRRTARSRISPWPKPRRRSSGAEALRKGEAVRQARRGRGRGRPRGGDRRQEPGAEHDFRRVA